MPEQHNFTLITGGATGIGFALARRFLADGFRVLIVGRRADTLSAARAAAPGLEIAVCDVADDDSRRALVDRVSAESHPLKMLINNAGVQHTVDFAASPPCAADIRAEVAVNLIAPLALTSELLPQLLRAQAPTIVNVTSGLAFCPIAAVGLYCATKAAMHSATISLRHQLRGRVRVVEIIPPVVDTALAGARRREDGPPALSPEDFAAEAADRLVAGEDEIAVGLAAALRVRGETAFSSLNGR